MSNAELKKRVIGKIKQARADGRTFSELEEEFPYGVSVHMICDLLNAKALPIEVWEMADSVMTRIGY